MPKTQRKPTRPAATLDDRDLKILEALRKNAWLSYAELSARVHLSASAVQRRVERLIRSKVILGAGARVSPAAHGKPLKIFVLIELADENDAAVAALARKLSDVPGCTSAHYVAGSFDVVVELQMASMEEYATFAAQTLNGNKNVRRYKTLTAMRPLC